MTRPDRSSAACVLGLAGLLSALLVGPVGGLPAAAAPDDGPLEVTMESLTPSVVPIRGRLEVAGIVTNRSDETWTDLQVYLLTSTTPITSRAGLAAAASTDPRLEIGPRLTGPGQFVEIGDLDPGESTAYSLSLPARELQVSGAAGVYWVGVHVLGAVDGIRDVVADGRARTFMPLMDPRSPDARVALVLPVRTRTRRDTDARLLGIDRWQRMLETGGRLRNVVDFAASSEDPLTLLVDPAVLDAAASVAADNPPLSTGPDGSGPEAGEDDGATQSPSASPSGGEDAGSSGTDPPPEPTQEAEAAGRWLQDFTTTAAARTVLALPYGDLDVAAVGASGATRLLRWARRLGSDTMDALEVNSSPVVAPPTGLLPERGFRVVGPDVPVLVSDAAFPGAGSPVVSGPGGTDVLLSDSTAGDGGPGPNPRLTPLSMRQRILSEAALHALSDNQGVPLVVPFPARWNPGTDWARADFFGGLDVPWLTQVDLPAVRAAVDSPPVARDPRYPRRLARRQVPLVNQAATRGVVRTGRVFADLLTENDTVADELARVAMLASSYHARSRPKQAAERAQATGLRVRRTMQRIDIEGPPFVMMSGGTGPVAVTVVNNLDEPVTVELEAQTPTDDLEIRTPDPLTLGPDQRSPVRMRADAASIGVHSVTIRVTTAEGAPLGSSTQFSVRTSNVGDVIWVIMGIGGAILALAIVVRLTRRVRGRRTRREVTSEEAAG